MTRFPLILLRANDVFRFIVLNRVSSDTTCRLLALKRFVNPRIAGFLAQGVLVLKFRAECGMEILTKSYGERHMKTTNLVILLAVLMTAGCVGEWYHGASWEAQGSEAPRSSPYEPTIADEEALRKAKHHNWFQVHSGKDGVVGYMMAEISELYDLNGPKKHYFVFDVNFKRIGFYTELGATYRYIFDDYKQTQKYIGRYVPEEGVAHLLKAPVPIKFVTVEGKRAE